MSIKWVSNSVVLGICLLLLFVLQVPALHESMISSMSQVNDSPDIVPLCWTGGFASTFRLCHYLLVQNRRVRPVYIAVMNMDNRKSIYRELQTMEHIRTQIHTKFPQWKGMLLDTHMIVHMDVDPTIKQDVEKSIGKGVPPLYAMLSQASQEMKPVRPLELIITHSTPMHALQTQVKAFCRKSNSCEYPGNSSINTRFRSLFSKLVFVFLEECFTSKEMHRIAHKYKFDEILDETWTCWFPKKESSQSKYATIPCGRCQQCLQRHEIYLAK
jgi:hypothetical protein